MLEMVNGPLIREYNVVMTDYVVRGKFIYISLIKEKILTFNAKPSGITLPFSILV
jgi:hypothetical protein